MYHGSNDIITVLKAGSYITPLVETAKQYGNRIYAIEVIEDSNEIAKINGRDFITGFNRGTCSILTKHPEYGFYEAKTHVDLPATFLPNV
jgi:hypothetical protein